jgi:hypothetical protein
MHTPLVRPIVTIPRTLDEDGNAVSILP